MKDRDAIVKPRDRSADSWRKGTREEWHSDFPYAAAINLLRA